MAADSRLTELLRWYAAQLETYVPAMCAAPGVLAKAGIIAGYSCPSLTMVKVVRPFSSWISLPLTSQLSLSMP